MRKTAHPRNNSLLVAIYCAIAIILVLSATNISNYLKEKLVLGITNTISEEEITSENEFWSQFLSDNPNYIPGWIELGRLDKVREIDPNYEL